MCDSCCPEISVCQTNGSEPQNAYRCFDALEGPNAASVQTRKQLAQKNDRERCPTDLLTRAGHCRSTLPVLSLFFLSACRPPTGANRRMHTVVATHTKGRTLFRCKPGKQLEWVPADSPYGTHKKTEERPREVSECSSEPSGSLLNHAPAQHVAVRRDAGVLSLFIFGAQTASGSEGDAHRGVFLQRSFVLPGTNDNEKDTDAVRYFSRNER